MIKYPLNLIPLEASDIQPDSMTLPFPHKGASIGIQRPGIFYTRHFAWFQHISDAFQFAQEISEETEDVVLVSRRHEFGETSGGQTVTMATFLNGELIVKEGRTPIYAQSRYTQRQEEA